MKPKSPLSIQRFTLMVVWPVLALSWALTSYFCYRDAHHEIDELFDAQLAQSAKLLAEQFSDPSAKPVAEAIQGFSKDDDDDDNDDDSDDDDDERESFHKYEQQVVFQVRAPNGRLLARSSPRVPSSPLSRVSEGYSTAAWGGHEWVVFGYREPRSGNGIQVAQRHRIRDDLSKRIVGHIFLPMLVFLPLSGLVIAFGIRRGLRPLQVVASEVKERTAMHLHRIDSTRVPAEARPLVDSLNSLLQRLEESFENERRFTADAAHELRTPLAGLKAQLQVASEAGTSELRNNALSKALQAVERMTHLISQLLELARLDQLQGLHEAATVDLRSVVADVISETASLAVPKGIEIGLNGEAASVSGNPHLLGILARNLIDNAIRYTPDGGIVGVSVEERGASVVLRVEDNGPGLRDTEKEQAFKRFFRGGDVQASGSGLGLSIVKRIAILHGADIELNPSRGDRGLAVEVAFPRNTGSKR